MTAIPDQPNALLTRSCLAEALTEAGYKIASPTLATKATRGGGPTYRLFNGRAIYRWADALEWAQSKLSTPRHNTSENDVRETEDAGAVVS
jgi:hypothetical protein